MYAVYAYVPIFCVYIHLLYRILKYRPFRIKSYYYYCFDYYLKHENLQRNNRNTMIIETYTVQEPPNLIARCAIKFNGTHNIDKIHIPRLYYRWEECKKCRSLLFSYTVICGSVIFITQKAIIWTVCANKQSPYKFASV